MSLRVSIFWLILMVSSSFLWTILNLNIAHADDETTSLQSQESTPVVEDNITPLLKTALVCESVRNGNCERSTVVLSVEKKQVFCYTLFENVYSPRVIYHRWYHRGELTTQIRLKLQPPRWATYSSIQLREADKGPWQVEIVDETGRIYGILRFSITD
ncbi:MAG: DUF2914 domain-containing protein [Thermodesulforhabdaceae bacterium]